MPDESVSAPSPPNSPGDAGFARALLGASLNGVYVFDLIAGTNTFVNGEYTRLTGYGIAELAAKDSDAFGSLFHPDDQSCVQAHLRAIRNAGDGEAHEIEYRFRRRDGTWIWCLSRDVVFERGEDGSARSILGTFLDISRRKRIEAELQASEAQARARLAEIELIYDGAPIGLCVLDRELRYQRVNEQLAQINGVPASAHIGKTVREVLPSLSDNIEPRLHEVLETGQPVLDVEVSGETPARPGVRRTWIESWLPLRGGDGDIIGLNIVAREVTDERAAWAALAESRERWRLVADFTYDWEYWIGPDGRMRWMSPSCERITGFSPERFLADPDLLARIVHPDDRALVERHLQQDQRPQDATRLQFRIRRADGAERWLEHLCQPVFDADGAFAGRRASTRDITETKQTEEALRRREREFATLADNSPDIVTRFDRDLRHLYVSAAVERATGRPPAEFLGKTNEELDMPPRLCARWSSTLREVLRTGRPQALDFIFPAPDGERYYSLRAAPECGPNGSIDSVVCITRDETARWQAEAELRTLAAVVEASADFIGIAELDGRAVYLNRSGQALVGLSGDQAVQATVVEDYLFPEDLPFVRETVMPQVMETGRWAGELRFRHFRTAEPIDVHWDILRIDDPNTKRPLRLATVTRDIRNEKAAQAAFIESSRRKDEFLAVLGHELRNPMAPIRNAIDLLRLLDDGKNPRVRRAIDILDRQSSQLKRLLDDLLDVSRIVRGKVKLECRPVELREVVQQAAEAVGGRMAECGHRFEVALPPGGILVDGDPVRLSQILLNLLLNAASYTADGGHVRLLAEWDDSRAVVRVLDNGRGIPPEQREALFEAFTQGRNGPGSTRSGGLGLGLAIARGLAEMHGGELRVESNWPQRGSEFSLHLPRRTGAAAVTDPTSTASADRRDALSILVVEDNADVAEALSVLLQALGHQVRTAASGADALRLATASCPRLAFLDIGLPDIDGLDLARRLREHFPDPHRLYLVALTGYGHAEARERSLAAGFDEHLAKPIDLQTLQALLARLH